MRNIYYHSNWTNLSIIQFQQLCTNKLYVIQVTFQIDQKKSVVFETVTPSFRISYMNSSASFSNPTTGEQPVEIDEITNCNYMRTILPSSRITNREISPCQWATISRTVKLTQCDLACPQKSNYLYEAR